MKRTKIWLLPILTLLLAGCTVNTSGTSTTTSGNAEDNTSQAPTSEGPKTVSNVEANTRLIAAIGKTITDDIQSIDATASGEAELKISVYDDLEAEPTQEMEVNVEASGTLKAKDLNKETTQMAATFDLDYEQMVGDVNLKYDFGGAAYYTDSFIYLDLTQSMAQGGQSESQSMKVKFESGPFPTTESGLLQTLLEAFTGEEEMTLVDLVTEANLPQFLPILNSIDNVEATETAGVLTIVYTITVEDVVDIFIELYLESMEEPVEEPTSEEIEELRNEILAMADEVLDLRSAKLTVKVSADGVLAGIGLELDADLTMTVYDGYYEDFFDEDGNYTHSEWVEVIYYQIVEVKGEVALDFALNKPVTITFPDFTDFALEEDLFG